MHRETRQIFKRRYCCLNDVLLTWRYQRRRWLDLNATFANRWRRRRLSWRNLASGSTQNRRRKPNNKIYFFPFEIYKPTSFVHFLGIFDFLQMSQFDTFIQILFQLFRSWLKAKIEFKRHHFFLFLLVTTLGMIIL